MQGTVIRLCASLAALSLGGCGFIVRDLDVYDGPKKPDSQLAIIHGSMDAYLISISKNGRLFFQGAGELTRRQVRLEAGVYEISYVFFKPDPDDPRIRENVDLMAGHSYLVDGYACIFFCGSHDRGLGYVWIKDETTGQVVSGTPY